MFKYGGDVKRQGIMHGMNGLRDGGVATTMADATGYANGGMTMFPPMRGRVTRPGGYAGEVKPVVGNFYRPELDERPYANQFPVPQKKEMSLKDKIFRPAPKETSIFRNYIAGDNTKTGQEVLEEKRVSSLLKPNEVIDQETLPTEYPQEFPTGAELAPYGKVLTGDAKIDEGEITADGSGNKSKTNLLRVTSNKEKDADRLKRIYDIMGVDEAKKDAVYNSLIDLSQAQAIDTKDISGSINRAVGALSRRADKVTDIKDKAKAAVASGTIQSEFAKELAEVKGTPYDQKEKYFTGKLGDVKGERAAVGSPLSVYDALITTKAGDSKSTRTEQAVTKYFDGIGGVPVYKGPIPGIELETIKVGEETEKADGAYRIGTGYIVVEKGTITEKKDLFPKK